MEEVKLHGVTLTKTETCLTYVLKRLGLDPNFCTYESFHDHFDQYTFKRRKLQIGDILLWDKDVKWEWLAWKISDDGNVSWKNVPVGFHFGIYEGDGCFTDCTRLVRMPHPSLRRREIKDLKKNPDSILVINKVLLSND
jgi:hypothetical protein